MTQEQTVQNTPERPLASLTTIYFCTPDGREFFKQNSPTGGTVLRCWVRGRDFAHDLHSLDLKTADSLAAWMKSQRMQPSTQEQYDAHFFQLCRELDAKRALKNQERQKQYEQINQLP